MAVERKEPKQKSKPWVILIEYLSENGSTNSIETTAVSHDEKIKRFLQTEAAMAGARIRGHQEAIASTSREKPSGKLRPEKEVDEIRQSHREAIDKEHGKLEALQGAGSQPIKIKIIDNQIADWVRLAGAEAEWAFYVRDNHPELLEFPGDARNLVQKVFMIRHAMRFKESGAAQEYNQLLVELRDKEIDDRLPPLFREISQRFSQS